MKLGTLWSVVAAGILPGAWGSVLQVTFDQPTYAGQPGDTVVIRVLLDPPPSAGLFSYGIKVEHPTGAGHVQSAAALSVPPELDFNGILGPGAMREVWPDAAGVKGTVDFFLSPPAFYAGTALAQFEFVCGAPGDYTLNLELFNTLGPTEEIFVTGDGEVLDQQIQFGSARLVVVPEPALCGLVVALGLLGGMAVHRCRVRGPGLQDPGGRVPSRGAGSQPNRGDAMER